MSKYFGVLPIFVFLNPQIFFLIVACFHFYFEPCFENSSEIYSYIGLFAQLN